MTTNPALHWPPRHWGGRIDELDARECRQLLDGSSVGRLGYVTEDGPRVVPMSYSVAADFLVLLTSVGSEPATFGLGRRVAFEVDHLDTFLRGGWSVLAVGLAQELTPEVREALEVDRTPEPWPGGVRSLFLQIGLDRLTGRRVQPA